MKRRTLPRMTRKQWEALPEVCKYFITWDRARRPLPINGARDADTAAERLEIARENDERKGKK
jgi:hypothetical protein